jgi:hypothetical protein
MKRWLAAAAASWLLGSGANAQMKGFAAVEAVTGPKKTHIIDLRISPDTRIDAHQPLVPSLIVRRDLGANSAIGVGLAKVYGKRRWADPGIGERTVRTRKPAVTFIMKF